MSRVSSMRYDNLHENQLKRLLQHKYSSQGTSLIEPLFQLFWKWVVEKVPLWWAPNAMTLLGLIFNGISTMILFVYSPDCKSEVPALALILAAIALFVYQTLDALDGKQARRTNSCSPLGELFDHGCDSINTVFVIQGLSIAMGMGTHPLILFINVAFAIFLFYAAHWQTYVSGTLQFGKMDVTEAQCIGMGIYLVSAVAGVGFWEYEVPVLRLQMKEVYFGLALIPAIHTILRLCHIVFSTGGVGRHGATVADTSVVSPVFPIALVIGLGSAIATQSPTNLYGQHPVLYLYTMGMVASKITNKLVIAHMTKSEMPLLDSSLFCLLLLCANQYFKCPVDESTLLIICATPHDDLDMNTVEFWNKRREKFPTIWKLAEVVLCVPHGNSTTERIFSALQDNFTKKRNRLEELTIDSLLHVKSMLSRMGVTCESIEVSSEMRSAAQAARHEYGVRLKIQRQIEEEEQARTRELEDVQKRLMEEEERRRHNEAVSKVESDLAEKRKSLEKQERVLKNTLVEYQKAMEKLSENRKAIEVEEIDLKKKKESLMRRSIISTLPRIPRIQTDVLATGMVVKYSSEVCIQIAEFLNINVFSIQKRKKKKST